MQLEQQETFEVKGPQLEVLGEVESKLPAPARKRPFAGLVLALAVAAAVFGIGGARLKGAQGAVLAQFSATDQYNHGIQSDLNAQADAAASMARIAGDVLGAQNSEVAAVQVALERFALAPLPQAADTAYLANAGLYSAVDGLYNTARLSASGDKAERIEELYATFVSAQATIDRAGAEYNEAAKAYNKMAGGFPANVVGALWGAGRVPLFAADGTGEGQSAAAYGEAHQEEQHDEAHHG